MRLAYKLFGESFKKKRSQYAYFEKTLKSARIPKTYDVYLAEAKFYSILIGVLGSIIGFLLYKFLLYTKILERIKSILTPSKPPRIEIYHPPLPIPRILPDYIQISGIKLNVSFMVNSAIDILIGVLFSLLFAFIAYFLSFSLFKLYPSMKADDRKRAINRLLPHAVNYMYALSKGGVGIIQIVRALSEHKEIYGEVANEFSYVVNLMDYFGYDFHSAMSELYEITPSDTMKEFVAGLITTIDSGGDLTVYLAHKCEQYVEKSKSEQKNFLETLGLLAEGYVTIAVTAPLFIIILQSVMLVIGSGNVRDLYGVTYLMIPASSTVFAFMVYLMSPKEYKLKFKDVKKEVEEIHVEEGREVYEKFKRAKAKKESLEKLKSPLKLIKEKPAYSLVFSLPISAVYILLFISSVRADFVIMTAVIIALLPLTVFQEMKRRRENIIKDQIPEVLKGLASVTATGATLQQAIEIVAESGKGYLYDEIKLLKKNLEWGADLVESLRDIAKKLKVPSLARVVTILTDVLTIGGDITETLHVCSRDAELERSLVRERRLSMFIYTIIIYVAFFTFVGIMFVLFTKLFPKFFEMATSASTNFMKAKVDKDTLVWILTQAMIMQAIFSGLVAGIIGEEEPMSGAKHTIAMLSIVLVVMLMIT